MSDTTWQIPSGSTTLHVDNIHTPVQIPAGCWRFTFCQVPLSPRHLVGQGGRGVRATGKLAEGVVDEMRAHDVGKVELADKEQDCR